MKFSLLLPTTVVGICGSLFLGYRVYFDRKPHSDPDVKKKLHKRKNLKAPESKKAVTRFPNLNDEVACQSFCMVELGKASQCFDEEKYDEAIDHVANSLVVYKEEERKCRIHILQNKYPPTIIRTIMQRIPKARDRLCVYQNRIEEIDEEEQSEITSENEDDIHKFVTDEMALANKCVESDDLSGAAFHYASILVNVDENEEQEILIQLRKNLSKNLFSLVLEALDLSQKRLREKLVQENQGLALKFFIRISLLCTFVSSMLR